MVIMVLSLIRVVGWGWHVGQTATAAGRATTKRAPCGRAGSHHRCAPIDSPSRLAAYRPMPEPRAVCVSRRAYGSKMRSRHSSGMPGPSSLTPSWTMPSSSVQSTRDGRAGRGVLDRVLDEVLDDLAQPRRVGQGVQPGRPADRDVVVAEQRRQRAEDLARRARSTSTGRDRRGVLRARPGPRPGWSRRGGPGARSARASRSCQAARVCAPLDVARLAAGQRRLLGQQVGVGADDGQRRAQLVGDQGDELACAPRRWP